MITRFSKRRILAWHWTVYAVLVMLFFCIGWIAYSEYVVRRWQTFGKAIEAAGGSVHCHVRSVSWLPDAPILGHYLPVPLVEEPYMVTLSYDSQLVPAELAWLRTIPSVKSLSLGTPQVGDDMIPMLATFRHLEKLDLTGTGLSADGVTTLAKELPQLKELVHESRKP